MAPSRWLLGALLLGGCAVTTVPQADATTADDANDAGLTLDASDASADAVVPTRSALERYCLMASSCEPHAPPVDDWDTPFSVTSCVRDGEAYFYGLEGADPALPAREVERWVQCGATAQRCEDYLACLSLGRPAPACVDPSGGHCEGEVLRYCAPPYRTVDCARYGQHCREHSEGGSVIALCSDGNTCAISGTQQLCADDRPLRCEGPASPLEVAWRCSDLRPGTACRVSPNVQTLAACVPADAPACNVNSDDRCDGNRVVQCRNGYEQSYDCTALEARCATMVVSPRTLASCAPIATECGDVDPDRCEGDLVSYCLHGRRVTAPCASGRCALVPVGSAAASSYAACR